MDSIDHDDSNTEAVQTTDGEEVHKRKAGRPKRKVRAIDTGRKRDPK